MMTKQEFKATMREMLVDANDPNGDYQTLVRELTDSEEARALLEHDPGLGPHFKAVRDAMVGLVEHIRLRASN